ncbi:MAG TPA: SDR family oxidoreductase [Candidatus Acidoferrum sp.]|jgi:short-subunit dehydrogenase|nr:SDR family oxidoreductase [Candidatus Acidoferrum sp.]
MKGWAVVTGASSGIGEEFARELARRSYPVLAVARRRERLDALAKQASAQGGRIESLTADLGTESGVGSVLQRLKELGEIELLINNAGLANADDFVGAPLDREVAAIKLNIEAVLRLTHGALQSMTRQRHGRIINVASVVAFQPFPHFAVYAASKAFVLSFTEALAEELRGTGVRVLALCPGAVRTEMEAFAHNEGMLGKLPSLTAEQVVKAGLRALEHGRVVKVVGGLNQFLPFMDRLMPRWAVRRLMKSSVKAPQTQTYVPRREGGRSEP